MPNNKDQTRATAGGALCGPYDPTLLDFDSLFGGVIWAHAGTRYPRVVQLSIPLHLTSAQPPTLTSVGNADPLAPQSVALADALQGTDVQVDSLFFPKDHQPPLGH